MAVQSNGITVAVVDDVRRRLRLLIGSVALDVRWDACARRLQETGRWWIDGRRSVRRPGIPDFQWRQAMRQAHAIARDRGWKMSELEKKEGPSW